MAKLLTGVPKVRPDWNSRFISGKKTYRGSFLARTLASNFRPFLATYSASLSMTGWMSGGGGMMAAADGVETGSSAFELFGREI